MTSFVEMDIVEAERMTIRATGMRQMPPAATPLLSVVIPVHNEAENIEPLIDEIHRALQPRIEFEIVCVDDASTDDTVQRLRSLMPTDARLRVLHHRVNSGQSTALMTGVRFARGRLIATLDGDGQNDPADIPVLLAHWSTQFNGAPLLLTGRRAARRDHWLRRLSSRIANRVRRALLKDDTADTGCGLKLIERSTYLMLPYFDHMHRFLPALVLRSGGQVVSIPVNHRPRVRGRSHYGVWNRLWVGLIDLAGVMWLLRRARRTEIDVVAAGNSSGGTPHES